MKSLSVFAVIAVGVAWVLWQLLPPHYHHFVETSYDQPYLVFAFESLVALAIAATLLLGVVTMQRGLGDTLVPWAANKLVRAQIFVASAAAITGIYGIRQVVQMNSMLKGDWSGQAFWLAPIVVLALSPWILFIAAAAVAVVAAKLAGAATVGVMLFDVLTTCYLAFIFAHIGYWACLTCSGPAL